MKDMLVVISSAGSQPASQLFLAFTAGQATCNTKQINVGHIPALTQIASIGNSLRMLKLFHASSRSWQQRTMLLSVLWCHNRWSIWWNPSSSASIASTACRTRAIHSGKHNCKITEAIQFWSETSNLESSLSKVAFIRFNFLFSPHQGTHLWGH